MCIAKRLGQLIKSRNWAAHAERHHVLLADISRWAASQASASEADKMEQYARAMTFAPL